VRIIVRGRPGLWVLAIGVGWFLGQPGVAADGPGILVAQHVDAADEAFENPEVIEGPWRSAPPNRVILLPQNIAEPSKFQPSVDELEVRVVHNGTWIGIAVRWADATRNETTDGGVFCDAVAVGFPLGKVLETSPFMGSLEAGMEVNHWKALWQRDIEHGYQDVTDLHPNLVADEYVGYRSEHLPDSDPASSAGMEEVMATPEAREGLPAIALGNPMSQIHREFPVEQSIAEGFGTLSTQQQQDARANGVYADGHWTVVICRPLVTGDDSDAALEAGAYTGINFAVWDGGEGDVGGRKSYSMFAPLMIAPKE
jgi:hypothetical protein